MKKFFKVCAVCLGVAFLFLWITNPTIKDFNDFVPSQARIPYKEYKAKVTVAKRADYIIYSVYEYDLLEEDDYGDTHPRETGEFIGFMKNFYKQ